MKCIMLELWMSSMSLLMAYCFDVLSQVDDFLHLNFLIQNLSVQCCYNKTLVVFFNLLHVKDWCRQVVFTAQINSRKIAKTVR